MYETHSWRMPVARLPRVNNKFIHSHNDVLIVDVNGCVLRSCLHELTVQYHLFLSFLECYGRYM